MRPPALNVDKYHPKCIAMLHLWSFAIVWEKVGVGGCWVGHFWPKWVCVWYVRVLTACSFDVATRSWAGEMPLTMLSTGILLVLQYSVWFRRNGWRGTGGSVGGV